MLSSDEDEDDTEFQPVKRPAAGNNISRGTNELRSLDTLSVTLQTRSGSAKATQPETNEHTTSWNHTPSPAKKKRIVRTKVHPKSSYSFFNSTTLHQTRAKIGAKSQDVNAERFELDIIQDDVSSDGHENIGVCKPTKLKLSRPLSTAKSKICNDLIPSEATKLDRVLKRTRSNSTYCLDSSWQDCRPWAEKYAPDDLDELAVHKKKVADVRAWLSNVLAGKDRKVI